VPQRRKRPTTTPNRRWRDYRTPSGRRVIKEYIDSLSDEDAAAIVAAMADVRSEGVAVAKHLRGEVYEVVADGDRQSYRLIFATEGQHDQVLLALNAFSKKTQKTPRRELELAERRLASWRRRGRP